MKKRLLLISGVATALICLACCGSAPDKTEVPDVRIQPKATELETKQIAPIEKKESKAKTLSADDKKIQRNGNYVSKDLSQKPPTLRLPESSKARGISVVAKDHSGSSSRIRLYNKMIAVVIGIDDYKDLPPKDHLTYAVKDAKGVESVLRKDYQFDKIITLYDREATRDNIMKVLQGELAITDPQDAVFVYFAGHGVTRTIQTGEGGELGYLIPYDGSLDRAGMHRNISMQQIKADVCPLVPAKHVFFVMDACFGGLLLDQRAVDVKPGRDEAYLREITGEHVRQVLTAGQADETVLDGGPRGHSVFTGRFIEALEEVKDYVTARQLITKISKEVYGDAATRGHKQRPRGGEIYGTGDFVFVSDLEKKGREISAEVDALEAEMTRLKRLKGEAAKARDQSREREIERRQLIKGAELKQAQIRRRQKEAAVKRQRQSALDAERLEKNRIQREAENEQRLAMLRTQAKKMRQDLSQNMTGGATIESAISELKKIKEQRDKIEVDFSTELRKQTQILAGFYDKKIARIADIPPWDKEFETKKDYQDRLAEARVKASPTLQAKEQKLSSLRYELQTMREKQISPLDNQMETLEEKRFIVPVSQVSFKFEKYYLKHQMMFGILTIDGKTEQFFVKIEPQKAREYKGHPELLVPEVLMKATVEGAKFDKVIFNGPGKNETYTSIAFITISDDGRFVTFSPGNEIDLKKGLRVVEREGSYVLYPYGIVKDTNTGLEWKAGPDTDMSWDDAKSWVESLNLDGGGWRMPTMDELEGLYKKGAGGRNLLEMSGWNVVWSGETKYSLYARLFHFSTGYKAWHYCPERYARAFAVRSRSDG